MGNDLCWLNRQRLTTRYLVPTFIELSYRMMISLMVWLNFHISDKHLFYDKFNTIKIYDRWKRLPLTITPLFGINKAFIRVYIILLIFLFFCLYYLPFTFISLCCFCSLIVVCYFTPLILMLIFFISTRQFYVSMFAVTLVEW